MPGGGAGGQMPGAKIQQAYQQGGSASDKAMRMGGAAAGEGAEAIGSAFGPEGKVIGKAASEAITMGTEGAIAAKNLVMSGGSLASQKAAAKAFKQQVVDKMWWPGMMMFPMNFLIYLPMLQVYWFASMTKSSWTTEMRTWEHCVLAILSFLEFLVLCFFLDIVGVIGCLLDADCRGTYLDRIF